MQDLLEFLSQRIREEDHVHKRAQYRRDMIKAIINSYPPKTPIHMREFSQVVGFNRNASSIYMMLNKMIAAGEIKSFGVGKGHARAYTVLKPGNTYDKERGVLAGSPSPEDLVPRKEVLEASARLKDTLVGQMDSLKEELSSKESTEKTYTFGELEELAMKHQFYFPGDTIAGFINSLKGEANVRQ